MGNYCITLYSSCILICRLWTVESLLHFSLSFSEGVFCGKILSDFSHVNRNVQVLQ